MTISSTVRKAGPYTGNGVTTVFVFDFKVFSSADLLVILTDASGNDATLELDADYSVTLNADQDTDPGGTVTYVYGGAALPSTKKLTILSNIELKQPTDIINLGGFYPRVIEDALDRSVALVQQASEVLDRALVFSPSDTATDFTLPTAAQRAHKALVFDADGNPDVSDHAWQVEVTNGTTVRRTLVAGVDFTAGTDDTIILAGDPLTADNLDIWFDGVHQQQTEWALDGVTVTFTAAIPSDVEQIEYKYVLPLSIGNPSDGTVTDDTVAADAAIDAVKLKFVQAGLAAIARTVREELRDAIKAAQFGFSTTATAANNTLALQAALDEAATRGGGKVLLPRGTFQFNGAGVVIPSNTTLAGEGYGYGSYQATCLYYTGTGTAISMGDNAGHGFYSKLENFTLKTDGTGAIGVKLAATRLAIENVTITAHGNTGFTDSAIKTDYAVFGTTFTHLFRNVYIFGCATGMYLRTVNNVVVDACFIESCSTNMFVVDATNIVVCNGTVLELFGPTGGTYEGMETSTSTCVEAVNVNGLVLRDIYSEVAANNTGVAIDQRFARLSQVVGGCMEGCYIYTDGISQISYPLVEVQDSATKKFAIRDNRVLRMVADGYVVGVTGTGNLAHLVIGNNVYSGNSFEFNSSFTPSLLIGGSATGITGSFKGIWNRHGSWITLSVTIALTSKGAGAGVVTVGNLPLRMQPRLDSALFISGTLFMSGPNAQNTAQSMSRISTGGTSIALRYRLDGSNNDTAYLDTDLTDTSEIYLSITYPVEP